jgi:hypothetical protein
LTPHLTHRILSYPFLSFTWQRLGFGNTSLPTHPKTPSE